MTSHSPKQNKPNVNKPETVPAPPAPIWGEIQESWGLLSDSRLPMLVKLVPGLIVIGYFIFPVDLIPDPILAIGQVDDMGVLLAGLMTFRHIAANYVGPTTLQPQSSSATQTAHLSRTTKSEADWVDAEWYESRPHTYQPVSAKRVGSILAIIGTILVTAILSLMAIGAARAAQCRPDFDYIIKQTPEEVIGFLNCMPSRCFIFGSLRTENLEILQYTTQKVLEERLECYGLGVYLGPERLLYIARGEAVLGVDLSKITFDDVQITDSGNRVTLKLPPAEAFHAYLDVENSQVVDYQKPGVCPNHKLEMLAAAQRRAQDEIEFSAKSEELLKITEEYAQGFMELFLLGFGFPEVEVTINSPGEKKGARPPDPVVSDGSEAPVSPAPEATLPPAPVTEGTTP